MSSKPKANGAATRAKVRNALNVTRLSIEDFIVRAARKNEAVGRKLTIGEVVIMGSDWKKNPEYSLPDYVLDEARAVTESKYAPRHFADTRETCDRTTA